MTESEVDLLSEVERTLKGRFEREKTSKLPSTAREVAQSERLDQLLLPEGERPKMPYTKDKYVIRENPHLIKWERETRKFLRALPLTSGHRVSAAMIYEWATGILVKDHMEEHGNPPKDLRAINRILRFHFGKPYSTYIMGRKVPNAYRVPLGWRVKYHRPMTMTLLAEYHQGVLNP